MTTLLSDLGNNNFKVLSASGYYAYEGTMTVADNAGATTNYSWSNPTGNGRDIIWSDQGNGKLDVASKLNDGIMTLRCTMSNGCGSAYKNYTFTTGVGPMIVTQPVYSVSPNPTSSNINVVTKITTATTNKSYKSTLQPSIKSIKIIDKTGKVQKIFKPETGIISVNIDVSDLPSDTYIVSIFDGSKWEDHKIMILQ